MAVTLAISDNTDGTGAVATISGTAPVDLNVVFFQAVNGQLGSGTWLSAGFISGNGTLSLPLPKGYYWAYCGSLVALSQLFVSNLVYFQITDAQEAVLFRCLAAVQARIQALLLTGVSNASVLVRKVASDRDVGAGKSLSLPAILISPGDREEMQLGAGTNLSDDVGYPILVSCLAGDNQDQAADFARDLGWRERIVRAFRHQRLAGVDEIYHCEVQPEAIVSPEAFFRQNLFVSTLVLRFFSREPRGLA